MKFSTSLLSIAVLTTTILASPVHKSTKTKRYPVSDSSNWSGAVITSAPSGESFNYIGGQFTVPNVQVPSGASSGTEYGVSIWIGIDGWSTPSDAHNQLFQGGINIDAVLNDDGSTSYTYTPFIEWVPDLEVTSFDFAFTAGDIISIEATATSSTTGTIVFNNLSQQISTTQEISAPSTEFALVGQDADWIVEDYMLNGDEIPFVDFESVIWTNCVAQTSSSSTDLSDANTIIVDLVERGIQYTDITIQSSSSVEITYQ